MEETDCLICNTLKSHLATPYIKGRGALASERAHLPCPHCAPGRSDFQAEGRGGFAGLYRSEAQARVFVFKGWGAGRTTGGSVIWVPGKYPRSRANICFSFDALLEQLLVLSTCPSFPLQVPSGPWQFHPGRVSGREHGVEATPQAVLGVWGPPTTSESLGGGLGQLSCL